MRKNGFTFLEVIVAIFVLTVGLGGSFSLISQTLSAVSVTKSRLIASYLAQEGVETVKNIRDSNWLEYGVSWDSGLLNNCQNCCEGDYEDYSLTSSGGCGFGNLHYLNIDSEGLYTYSSGDPTPFKRKILITQGESSEEMEIEVEVMWKERGKIHSFKILENITNWYGD